MPAEEQRYVFDEYELDGGQFELRHRGRRVPMEPQVFEVLEYLVRNHGRVVPKDELLDHVWPERFISEAALNSRLMAARKAIGDDGKFQRLIRTVHGRGYRFVGQVAAVEPGASMRHALPPDSAKPQVPDLAGREDALAFLRAAWRRACDGTRQVVFVTGEGGIGKSSLVESFVATLVPPADQSAAGQCVELSGPGEAFLPVFDALGQLLRGEAGGPASRVLDLLKTHAPTWVIQLPSALSEAVSSEIAAEAFGANRQRMLREFLVFLDALSRSAPVLLVLEDLHWSDPSTVDLLGAIARRPEPARLLVVGTCRLQDTGAEALQRLKAELRIRGLCSELALGGLGPIDVAEIAERRLPGVFLAPELAAQLTRRCGGNPLFLGSLLDHLFSQGVLQAGLNGLAPEMMGALQEVPGDLRDLLQLQHSRLSAFERGLLEAAAIVGQEFNPGLLAQLVDDDEEAVERACQELTASGPLVTTGTSDSLRADLQPTYAFVHDLHRETIEAGTPRVKRVRLHLRVGHLMETRLSEGTHVPAAEVAEHFELGGEMNRAVLYRREAAAQAYARSGYEEAARHLRGALRLLATGEVRNAAAEEMAVQAALAPGLISLHGFGMSGAEQAWRRTMELARELGNREHEGAAVLGLVALLEYRGQHRQAEELLEQLGGQVTESAPGAWMPFHAMLSCSAFHQGNFETSVVEGQLGLSVQTVGEPDPRWALFGEEPINGCREWSALALWFLGRPDGALARIQEAVLDARRPGRRYALAAALVHAARIRQLRREPREAEALAREALDIALSHGFAYHHATALVLAGWGAAGDGRVEEGLAEMERGIQAHEQTGALMDRPYFQALLAERLQQAGRIAAAQKVTDQALHEIGGEEFFYRAELLRLRALLLGDRAKADHCLVEAIAVAKLQGSRALELRCTTALARLRGDRDPELLESLVSAIASSSEGLSTPDVQEARKLAHAMSPGKP